ncbi:HlyD family secretion protein [Telluria beijingensis]|uniref:HlyD family secretion protein n=1 Tax=Telluria beijingensis TaxID=3068633 RepID=UPI00279565DB|nr:HlyD family secretion protein [Massilia sp. REN29]
MALPKQARIASAVLLLAAAAGALYYLNAPESGGATQSTDHAYVQVDFTTVAPEVAGIIETVHVRDNQVVERGALLATIDDRDFVVALDAAKAQVASAQAGIASLEAHLAQQQNAIRQAQAVLAADEASLKLANVNQARYRNLASDGSGSVQALQQAEMQFGVQAATRDRSRAALQAARQVVVILGADLEKARAALLQARAAQAAAELKLSYTRIVAPVAGTVGQKAVRVGAWVNPGKPLLAIVPLDAVYITANFRETQLARVAPGQPVDIEVDALPGVVLKGSVDSLGPASGASYSAIAPYNATGNFTKIVQRLPVRIAIVPGQAAASKLRAGMSVTPTIRTAQG